ncbi:MAG: helix-turn-helix domain-containing protein, partial [Proteobacteria bacterium]|nr:helix-turn-helix domain-containing protein [Pseudomonadota bacterium]
GMSVTEAAKKLGVSRPTLSNLLNEKISLSAAMAKKLEATFGADGNDLLRRQAKFDAGKPRDDEAAGRAYVHGLTAITARQIEGWARGNREARSLLAVLLRRLVHSTGLDLTEVDFPGYDNAERKGWDGTTVAGAATAWIPKGKACWEFSVTQNPGGKADSDYLARTHSMPAHERKKCSFIFVTPRNWEGKSAWVKRVSAARDWRTVRAYDASDLEQWLEVSIAGQLWFAEQCGAPLEDSQTLDGFWRSWASGSKPPLTRAIFEPSVGAWGKSFSEWLEKNPQRPLVVAADSRDEALAFLAVLFEKTEEGHRAVIIKSAHTLRKLVASSVPIIPIVSDDDMENELAVVYQEMHCIIVRPRNAVAIDPDVVVDRLDHDGFIKALATMGISNDIAVQHERASGRSPTILRRRLSEIPAIRVPTWAEEEATARRLIPIALAGAWDAASAADRGVLSMLAGRDYDEFAVSIRQLLHLDDSPVWSTGQHRGVASKLDALYAIGKQIIDKDVNTFFSISKRVLSEPDPALELPEDERWAAGAYGKVRDHSAALRQGVCETLIILSVHGENLLHPGIGIGAKDRVDSFIMALLTPLTYEKLLLHRSLFPYYAEAAPDAILGLLENDLRGEQPAVLQLIKPTEPGPFSTPARSELLWALECLAWKNLGRVGPILGRLSETVIEDNWTNKPINSLGSIYRSWMPQTAASTEDRVRSLEKLRAQFPSVCWKICVEEFSAGPFMGFNSYRPRWRSDASGSGQPLTSWEEINRFRREALRLVLDWPEYDGDMLADLVERIDEMREDEQSRVWEMIDSWAASEADEVAKARLAKRLRDSVLTRRGAVHGVSTSMRERVDAARRKLQSADPVVRNAWLFANSYIEMSADELDEEDMEAAYERHDKDIFRHRTEAMGEIWDERGIDGIVALLSGGAFEYIAGNFLAACAVGTEERADILNQCLSVTGDVQRSMDFFIGGFLGKIETEERARIISKVVKGAEIEQAVRVFRCAPFSTDTWGLVTKHGEDAASGYWKVVAPQANRYTEGETTEIIDRFLEAKRPRAAFESVRIDWTRVETSRLKRLLLAIATVDEEPEGEHRINPYYVSKALDALNARASVTEEEMAQFEFLFVSLLGIREYRVKNLELQVAKDPEFFVRLLTLAFRRNDGREDPRDWKVKESERKQFAMSAHWVLERIGLIPGTKPNGSVDAESLINWITEVRRLCADFGRAEIGDQKIGQLLSRADAEAEGVWPGIAVCEAIERVGSSEMGRGFAIAVYNARGVHLREKGGAQERELAARYRGWASQLKFEYPYMNRVLEKIAAGYDREAQRHDERDAVEDRLDV